MKVGDIVWLADSAHNTYMYKLKAVGRCWGYTYNDVDQHHNARTYLRIDLSDPQGPSRSVLVLDNNPSVFFVGGKDAHYSEAVVVLYGESMIMLNRGMLVPQPFPEVE